MYNKINKMIHTMKTTNQFSIAKCEKLNDLMTKAEILPTGWMIRFRPLFGDFDFVPVDWFKKFH